MKAELEFWTLYVQSSLHWSFYVYIKESVTLTKVCFFNYNDIVISVAIHK